MSSDFNLAKMSSIRFQSINFVQNQPASEHNTAIGKYVRYRYSEKAVLIALIVANTARGGQSRNYFVFIKEFQFVHTICTSVSDPEPDPDGSVFFRRSGSGF